MLPFNCWAVGAVTLMLVTFVFPVMNFVIFLNVFLVSCGVCVTIFKPFYQRFISTTGTVPFWGL